jgi:transketolase
MQDWSNLDEAAVTISRALAMDAVQKVGNGHPGTAMALAPVAYRLFQKYLRHNPLDPNWIGRDRFVLSAGHSSLTLYIQLFLSGYGLEIEDLKSFRTLGSATPGHPEFGHTKGVEITTGPLGSGISSAVGMAMASRYEKGLFDPDNETTLFDHNIWVIASDGDLQEGISSESSSLAGTQALGNLKVIYDDNSISIEGATNLAFTEDVSMRYRAYGWHVIEVDTKSDGDVDLISFDKAMQDAISISEKPVLIRLKTVIAWPAPAARNTPESHGSALGATEVAQTKKLLGLNPDVDFYCPDEILKHTRGVQERGAALQAAWRKDLAIWRSKNNERSELLDRLSSHELPRSWSERLPIFTPEKEISTRAASGKVLNAIANELPEFWGGSADLAGSNNTNIVEGGSFLPTSSKMPGANPYGRIIHFGIREHAMGAILNGIALHGLTRVFGGTFLVFSDYMRGAVRLAALMDLPVTYIWSHDSIGVGEDGPTHQPIEHLAALRAIPNLSVVRPADANEVTVAWAEIVRRRKPVGLILSRQNLPVIDRSKYGNASGVVNGAYVVCDTAKVPDAILIATGSEVHLAIKAAENLKLEGIAVRVVSAPSLEWFSETTLEYQESVLPKTVRARVAIEAGVTQGWHKWVGDSGRIIGIDHFGASASAGSLFEKYGFTVENLVNTVKSIIQDD